MKAKSRRIAGSRSRSRIGFEWLAAIYIFFRQYLARFGARVADAE